MFATTWIDLEGNMVSEISQGKTNNVYFHLYGESKNQADILQQTRNRLTDAENKPVLTKRDRVRVGIKEMKGIKRYKILDVKS